MAAEGSVSPEEGPRVYRVILSEPAELEIEAAYLRLMGLTSLEYADRWQDGLLAAIQQLDLFPTGYEIAPESTAFRIEVRRKLYRMGSVSYRILYTLIDADGDGERDTVRVLHVRHAARPFSVRPNGDDRP